MSGRSAFRADWLRDNVRLLRAGYERSCRAHLSGRNEWCRFEARGRMVRALIHGDPDKARTVIVYLHGGGWIAGSPLTHADITGDLHERAGLPILSVDYGLAPESNALAAIADGIAALEYVFKGPAKTVILCGDSAGASLAMAVERQAPANLRERIAGVGSFYGAFRQTGSPSIAMGTREAGLDRACLRRYWLAANGSRGQAPFSLGALIRSDGCPAYILAGSRDPVRDDSIMLARALKSAGRSVTLTIVPFADHGFLHRAHRDKARDDALKNIAAWINQLDSAAQS
jgi:acetyl esterase